MLLAILNQKQQLSTSRGSLATALLSCYYYYYYWHSALSEWKCLHCYGCSYVIDQLLVTQLYCDLVCARFFLSRNVFVTHR